MPLTPLPSNNTVRAWLKYTSNGIQHELCFRLPAGSSAADVVVDAGQLATYGKALLRTTDSFSALRMSAAGSNLSFPLSWTAIAGLDSSTIELQDKAKFFALSGRSAGGYRCRLTLFNPASSDDLGYRVASSGGLVGAVAGLTHPLVAVDGQPVIWNQYINIGYNSYWQRQQR